ncbi:MAG: class I SAM-dependent methyltransferase [Pirellulaceae bacterium]|nr:class I SAM-dependent methyltransferase [Pirellulaceae bacterium]
MKPLTQIAHEFVAACLQGGDIAVDLTAGNGRDTLFLAQCVGETGHVFAFDIQEKAVHATRTRLREHGIESVVTLHCLSHADWSSKIELEHSVRIKAIMMNLGYLPGGDKSVVTQSDSTKQAIEAAVDRLQPGGIFSILCYTGHPGGEREAEAVQAKLSSLDPIAFDVKQEPSSPAVAAPILYLVYRRTT